MSMQNFTIYEFYEFNQLLPEITSTDCSNNKTLDKI